MQFPHLWVRLMLVPTSFEGKHIKRNKVKYLPNKFIAMAKAKNTG